MPALDLVQWDEFAIGANHPQGRTDTINRVIRQLIEYSGRSIDDENLQLEWANRKFNVLNFGVLGNGTDETNAIQSAIDAVCEQGGILEFPAINDLGFVTHYGITAPLVVDSQYPVHLRATMITRGPGATAQIGSYICPLTDLNDYMIKYQYSGNRYDAGSGSIQGITLYDATGRTYAADGFYLYDFSGGKVEDCHVRYLKGTGFSYDMAVQGSMVQCTVRDSADTGKFGVDLGDTADSTYVVQSFHIIDCRFEVLYGTYIRARHVNNQGSNKIAFCQFESNGLAATENTYIDTDQFKNQVVSCTFNRNHAQHIVFGTNGTDFIFADCQHDGDTTDGVIQIRTIGQRGQISNIKSRAAVSNTGTQVSVEGNLTQVRGLVVTTGGKISITGALCNVSDIMQYQCKVTSGYAISITGSSTTVGGGIWVHTTLATVDPIECAATGQSWNASILCQNIEGTGSPYTNDPFYDSGNRGDADVTLKSFRDTLLQRFATALTAARTITLPAANRYHGQRYRIMRTAGGAYGLSVGGLTTLYTNQFCEVVFNGTSWMLASYGDIPDPSLGYQFTPEQFGATGDGSADDTTAVQAAITAAAAVNGAVLFRKRYKVTSKFTLSYSNGVELRGINRSKIIKAHTDDLIRVNGGTYYKFTDLTIDCQGSSFAGGRAFLMDGSCSSIWMTRCRIENSYSHVIEWAKNSASRFYCSDCFLGSYNPTVLGGAAFYHDPDPAQDDTSASPKVITNCLCEGLVWIKKGGGVNDCTFVNCFFHNAEMTSGDLSLAFHGCKFAATGNTITVDGANTVVQGCVLAGPVTINSTFNYGIFVANASDPTYAASFTCNAPRTAKVQHPTGQQPVVGVNRGNTAVTLTIDDSVTQKFNTALTADRDVTLPSSGVYNGARFRIIRQAGATGAFNINVKEPVGPTTLKVLATAGTWVDVEYDAETSRWILTACGSL